MRECARRAAEVRARNLLHGLITVYRRTFFGRKLVGGLDDANITHQVRWSNSPHEIVWTIGSTGRVYMRHNGLNGYTGTIDKDGSVYAEYAYQVRRLRRRYTNFDPAYVFVVRPNGDVYERTLWGVRLAGQVEGTTDLHTMGALALLLLIGTRGAPY